MDHGHRSSKRLWRIWFVVSLIAVTFMLYFLASLYRWGRSNAVADQLDQQDLFWLENRLNRDSLVRNGDKFHLAPDHVPIVIYVYRRHEYLRQVCRLSTILVTGG